MGYIDGQREKIELYATYGEASAYSTVKSFFDRIFSENRNKRIDIVCVGTDKVLFDAVGPLIGTFIKDKVDFPVFGTLSDTVNKTNVGEYVEYYRINANPNRVTIAIDASVGEPTESTIGQISMKNKYLIPASGVGCPQGSLGDYSVKVVTCFNTSKFTDLYKGNGIGLNSVYEYARLIADAILASYDEYIAPYKAKLENKTINDYEDEYDYDALSYDALSTIAASSLVFRDTAPTTEPATEQYKFRTI